MSIKQAAARMEALGNPVRLNILHQLVNDWPLGVPVGVLQKDLGIPASTLSHHLKTLIRVGLVQQIRQSRILICLPCPVGINELTGFLSRDLKGKA